MTNSQQSRIDAFRATLNKPRPANYCECGSCMRTVEETPVTAFIRRVHQEGVGAHAGFWTGFAQGVLAGLQGQPLSEQIKNDTHSVSFDFCRGHAAALDGSYINRVM